MESTQKKKFFIAFSWTGMDQTVIERIVRSVADKLRVIGHEVYVNLEDENVVEGEARGKYVVDAIKKLEAADVLLALKVSRERSEGQIMEIGAAKALKKPVVLCLQYEADENTYLNDSYISDQVIMWEDTDDLLQKLEGITV